MKTFYRIHLILFLFFCHSPWGWAEEKPSFDPEAFFQDVASDQVIAITLKNNDMVVGTLKSKKKEKIILCCIYLILGIYMMKYPLQLSRAAFK